MFVFLDRHSSQGGAGRKWDRNALGFPTFPSLRATDGNADAQFGHQVRWILASDGDADVQFGHQVRWILATDGDGGAQLGHQVRWMVDY